MSTIDSSQRNKAATTAHWRRTTSEEDAAPPQPLQSTPATSHLLETEEPQSRNSTAMPVQPTANAMPSPQAAGGVLSTNAMQSWQAPNDVQSTVQRPQVVTERAPHKWLLGMDDREPSEWAFNYALNSMDKVIDTLIIIAISKKKIDEEQISRNVLLKFAVRAERLGVKNVRFWLYVGKEVGPVLCQVAKDIGANTLLLGHNQGHRSHTVTKYCNSHSPCAVSIQREYIPLQRGEDLEAIERDDAKLARSNGPDNLTESLVKHFTVKGHTYTIEVTP